MVAKWIRLQSLLLLLLIIFVFIFTLFHIQQVFISTVNADTYKFNSDISKEALKLSMLHEQYTVATYENKKINNSGNYNY